MKTQEQIIFENICLDLKTGDYAVYLKHPQSVGAVCQWLRAFGLREYDRVQIGFRNEIGSVTLWGKVFATFRFIQDIPRFTFNMQDELSSHLHYRQETYHAAKHKYKDPFENGGRL